MNSELEALSLPELIGRLRDVHTMKTPMGWPTDSAVTKSSIERRIFEIVARSPSKADHDVPADRISCDITVKIRSANRPSVKSKVIDLRPGGLFIGTEAPFTVSESLELEIETDNNFKLKVKGNADWLGQNTDSHVAGVGVGFHSIVGDSSERRVHRFILELLRNRVDR